MLNTRGSDKQRDVIHPRTCERTDLFHSVSPSCELPSGLTLREQRAPLCDTARLQIQWPTSHPWRHPARTACPIISLTSANRSIWEVSRAFWEMPHVNSDINHTFLQPNFSFALFFLLSLPIYIHYIYTCALSSELI